MDAIEAILPLLPSQRGIFVESQVMPLRYTGQQQIELIGLADTARLGASWLDVCQAHQGLRTSFRRFGKQLLQVIHAAPQPGALQMFDLTGVHADDRALTASAICEDECRRGVDLNRGPVARLALLQMDADRVRLCLTHHHIAVDGRSLSVIYDDLARRYDEMLPEGARATLIDVMRTLTSTAPSPRRHSIAPHSLSIFPETGMPPVTESVLASASAESLYSSAADASVTPSALVLAAWLSTVHRIRGSAEVSCAISRDVRPPRLVGSDRVVGMLTETSIVSASITPRADLAMVARQIQEELADGRPAPALSERLREMWRDGASGRPDTLMTIYSEAGLPDPPTGLDWRLIATREATEFAIDVTVTLGTDIGITADFDIGRVSSPIASFMANHMRDLLRSPMAKLGNTASVPAMRVTAIPGARAREAGNTRLDTLLSVARRVLGRDVGETDNLISAGADSLVMIGLVAGLAEAGWQISVGGLMEARSLEEAARKLITADPAEQHGRSLTPLGPPDPSLIESGWLNRTCDPSLGADPLHEQSVIGFAKVLDPDRFRDAVVTCLAHLPSLDRIWESAEPHSLRYRNGHAPDVEIITVRGEEGCVRDAIKQARDEDIARPFRPDGSALARFRLIAGDGVSAVCLSFHHALLDGWSFATFIRCLQSAYEGEPLTGTDCGDYRKWCRERPLMDTAWASLLGGAMPMAATFPACQRPAVISPPDLISSTLVQDAARRHGVSTAVMIQAAAAHTCCDVLDQPRDAPVGLRMSLRDGSPRASAQTVGQLSADIPILPADSTVGLQTQRVAKTIRSAYASGHIGETGFRSIVGCDPGELLVQNVITVENYYRFDENMVRLLNRTAWPEIFSWRREVSGAPTLVTLTERESHWKAEISTITGPHTDLTGRRFVARLRELLTQ
jgi:aryl carrier-like protein